MSKLTRYTVPSTAQLLHHIFDRPQLVAAVRDLHPVALGKLIEHVGLEDAGELVALASLPQLERIFDDDLWRAERQGGAEHFDAQRFALWLGALLEAGESFVAKRLVELPRDLVTLAVHRLVLVIDIEALAMQASESGEDFEPIEKALEDNVFEEWDEFRLIARDNQAWDTVLAALLSLDRDYSEDLRDILEHCCAMSAQYIEDNGGLCEVLTAEESLEDDVAGERQDRRAAVGFVSPTDAQSFLAGIAVATRADLASDTRDPVAHAYFRELGPELPADPTGNGLHGAAASTQRMGLASHNAHTQLLRLLQGAEILQKPEPRRRHRLGTNAARDTNVLPRGTGSDRPTPLPFERGLIALAGDTAALVAQRKEELSFLANVLISGCSLGGRRMRPIEALEAAVAATNLGLELAVSELDPTRGPAEVLQRKGADRLFRVGWRALQEQVVESARATLRALLDHDTTGEIDAAERLRIEPLLAAGASDVLRLDLRAVQLGLDQDTFVALLALIETCPTLTGPLADHEAPAHAHAAFVAHRTQVARAQRFLHELLRA
jgi:hypothetical protein